MLKYLTLLAFVGCVAPAEVKQASAEVGVALNELSEAQREFEKVYLREIQKTREQIGRAIVARAVKLQVEALATAEYDGDLGLILETIHRERAAWGGLVTTVLNEEPIVTDMGEMVDTSNPHQPITASDLVDDLLHRRAVSVRASAEALNTLADSLDAAGKTAEADRKRRSAEELVLKAEALDNGLCALTALGSEAQTAMRDDLVNIVELAAMKAPVRTGMRDFADYTALLRMMHSEVNEWIVTDAAVSGADIARLISKHAETLGLDDGGAQ